ncbi:hypothetical protein B5P46_03720 [Rhizobium leguminosarum]|uniref:Uncharacterized protein n=1 Tax=Rhizobium leguminosarum TaxID=384 RepID=A0A4Q1UB44_RHILE|nr:hypothetical protein B5P46_03720 [Rhizobium leguminosarum]
MFLRDDSTRKASNFGIPKRGNFGIPKWDFFFLPDAPAFVGSHRPGEWDPGRPVQISRCLCRQPLESTTTTRHCSSRPERASSDAVYSKPLTAPADSGRAGEPCRPSR